MAPSSRSLILFSVTGALFPGCVFKVGAKRFGSIEDARSFCRRYFHWYNHQHRHSGIGMMTPASVHEGRAKEIRAARQVILDQAFQAHPERFSKGCPKPPALPSPAWINPPKKEVAA